MPEHLFKFTGGRLDGEITAAGDMDHVTRLLLHKYLGHHYTFEVRTGFTTDSGTHSIELWGGPEPHVGPMKLIAAYDRDPGQSNVGVTHFFLTKR